MNAKFFVTIEYIPSGDQSFISYAHVQSTGGKFRPHGYLLGLSCCVVYIRWRFESITLLKCMVSYKLGNSERRFGQLLNSLYVKWSLNDDAPSGIFSFLV